MIRLFETVAIKKGQIMNVSYHNQRFIQGQLFLKRHEVIDDIQKLICINDDLKNKDCVRCRITYNQDKIDVTYFDYTPKNIQSFKVVYCDDINYDYKYDDRELLNQLLSKKQNCDEIIIIKNGFVTDCSIGNLLFFKSGQWFTSDTPLLCGTQRQYLLDNKKIQSARITVYDIKKYQKIMMINALNAFDERRAINVDKIIF